MDEGFIARDHLDRLIKFWWIIFICMLLGAGAGWLIHHIKPPVYEAKSTISTAINYAETGFLTDLEEDHALSVVGEVIMSDAVITDLNSSLEVESLDGLEGGLRDHLFAEREGYRWTLRVQAESSAIASQISSKWAESAMNHLDKSLEHSRQALVLSRQISELEKCLSQSISVLPSQVPCDLAGAEKVNNRLNELGEQYRQEQSVSNGIMPVLVFSLTQTGTSDGTPITFPSAGLILVGALLGFLAGMILILARVPDKLFKAPVRGE
jgi:hypothetical protein